MIETLMGKQAIIDVQDHDGDTPLHYATITGQVFAVDLLLNRGAQQIYNYAGEDPFRVACSKPAYWTLKESYNTLIQKFQQREQIQRVASIAKRRSTLCKTSDRA